MTLLWSRLIIVAVLLAAPIAGAGSASAPELSDSRNDLYDQLHDRPISGTDVAEADVLAVWFEELDDETFRVTISVDDVHSTPRFRDGSTIRTHAVIWTVDGDSYTARIDRTASELLGRFGAEGRYTDVPVALDAADNVFKLDIPRGGAGYLFDDGTEFEQIRVQVYDSMDNGAGNGCLGCNLVDIATTANTFVFGTDAKPLPHVVIEGPVVASDVIDMNVLRRFDHAAVATIRAVPSEGWKVSPEEHVVDLSNASSQTISWSLTPPSNGAPGHIYFEGAMRPHAVLVVDAGTVDANAIMGAFEEQALLAKATIPLYLNGVSADSTSFTTDPEGSVRAAQRLETSAPVAAGHSKNSVTATEPGGVVLGIWQSDPVLSPVEIRGFTATIAAAWSGAGTPELSVLAAGTGLPTVYQGSAPEGVLRATAPLAPGVTVIESTDVMRLAPGDRFTLVVSAEVPATGVMDMSLFGKDVFSAIELHVNVPVAASAGELTVLRVPSLFGAVPRADAIMASPWIGPAVQARDSSFQGVDGGQHDLTLQGTEHVDLVLTGDDRSAWTMSDLDVVVRKDGQVIKASHSRGPWESFSLTPFDLDGPGTYTIDVVSAGDRSPSAYTLDVTISRALYPGAYTDLAMVRSGPTGIFGETVTLGGILDAPGIPKVPIDVPPVLGEEPTNSEANGATTVQGSGNPWIAGLFVVFGLVAAYEATVITRKLRSRAAQRALDAPNMDGVMLRSRAAQRAAIRAKPNRTTIRCSACKTVQFQRGSECVECNEPLPQKVTP